MSRSVLPSRRGQSATRSLCHRYANSRRGPPLPTGRNAFVLASGPEFRPANGLQESVQHTSKGRGRRKNAQTEAAD